MATIRNQRNSNSAVLNQDRNSLTCDVQAVSALGSLYLPSVFGSMLLQPARMFGRKHGTARHLDHGHAKPDERVAWSGRLGRTGLRATSVITIN
jgi:hypothetical protein